MLYFKFKFAGTVDQDKGIGLDLGDPAVMP